MTDLQLPSAASGPMLPTVMQIDAHQHFWQVSRGDYHWMSPAQKVLFRDYGPDDLEPFLERFGISRTILVQAAQTAAETEFLLRIAAENPMVAGVVGWAEFADPDAPKVIAELARNPLLVGLRPMVQDIPDDDWLLRGDLAPAFTALVEHGLVFDALVHPRHLCRLLLVVDRHPTLRIVLDHGAKPFIREGLLEPWRADITALAARPNVVCKLSGLVTEAAASWDPDSLRPYVSHLLQVFGPQRLLWGSDWPVVNLAGGYDRWRETSMILLAGLTEPDRAAVLGGNAARIYLDTRGRR